MADRGGSSIGTKFFQRWTVRKRVLFFFILIRFRNPRLLSFLKIYIVCRAFQKRLSAGTVILGTA